MRAPPRPGSPSARLNEGLPQKGKRCPSRTACASAPSRLNEGLPQKGKRYAVIPSAPLDEYAPQ